MGGWKEETRAEAEEGDPLPLRLPPLLLVLRPAPWPPPGTEDGAAPPPPPLLLRLRLWLWARLLLPLLLGPPLVVVFVGDLREGMTVFDGAPP